MGKQPSHHAICLAARRMVLLTLMIILMAAPLVVSLTHGPEIDAVSNTVAHDGASHGHVHADSGKSHNHPPASGHNPADHDHQLQALVNQATSEPKPPLFNASGTLSDAFRNLMPDGPRRPPRLV
ncbi:MAG: hypothetical protein AAFW76_06805 [Pseudomonadota bacterium]